MYVKGNNSLLKFMTIWKEIFLEESIDLKCSELSGVNLRKTLFFTPGRKRVIIPRHGRWKTQRLIAYWCGMTWQMESTQPQD